MATKQRDITFDIMKGVGILLVMTCHFFGWNHPVMSNAIRSFHMPMFFIVAGYFSKGYEPGLKVRTQFKKYANRLFWPFVFTQLLIVVWLALMVFAKHESWNPVISHALSLFWADVFGPATPWGTLSIGVVWFLLALLVAKVLLIPLSRSGNWCIPISLAIAFVTIMLHKVFPYSIWSISLGLTALPFVTIGWWVRSHNVPVWVKCLSVVAWIAAICFSSLDMYSFTWQCYPLDVLGACGGTYCLYMVCRFVGQKFKCTSKVFATLGLWSLAIMCVHCFEMAAHLNNHVLALMPVALPIWAKSVFRYVITIGLAAALVNTPKVKKLFI